MGEFKEKPKPGVRVSSEKRGHFIYENNIMIKKTFTNVNTNFVKLLVNY